MRVVPVLALVAGCTGSSFSKDDSNAMMKQLAAISSTALDAAQPPLDAPPPVALSIDQTVACQGSGHSTIAGDLSGDVDQNGTGSYSLDLMTTFSDCNIGNGVVVSGAPYLSTTGMFTFDAGTLTGSHVTYTGAFTANGDTCNIDFTVTLASQGPRVPLATGAICGNAVQLAQH